MPEVQTPPDSGAGTGTPPEGGAPPSPPEAPKPVTFESQEALDRMIADRVRRAVANATPPDYNELLELKKRTDAEAEAAKTETERQVEAQKERERKSREREQRANAKLIRAAVLEQASAQNALDGEVVAALLSGSKDITVTDEGEVTGVKEAVEQLLTDKPTLVKGKSSSSGGEFGGNDPKTTQAHIAELERKMNDPSLSLRERQDAGREARALKMGTLA